MAELIPFSNDDDGGGSDVASRLICLRSLKTLTFPYFQQSLDAHDRDLLNEADRQPDAIDIEFWRHFETAHNFLLQEITTPQGPLLQKNTLRGKMSDSIKNHVEG